MMTTTSAVPVPVRTKLAYGFGAVAYGIKDNGFSVFLLIYYNQVIGLPAGQVGLAIMIALFVDAFIDPVIGHLSDQTHTRWGRRHPWLYASAIPIALAWLLLWNPPHGSHTAQFAWLIGAAILVRATLSSYEIPSIALTPEITRDYHERTIVLRYRFLFGWAGGLGILALAFSVLLVPGPGYPNGQLNPAGYHRYALVGAVAMVIAVLVSALGTHKRFARLPAAEPERLALGPTFGAIFSTLSNRAFLTLMLAAVFAFANQGIAFALANYLLLYVWELPQQAFIVYAITLFGGAVVAFLGVGEVSRRLGKKYAAALLALVAVALGTSPYWLRLAGAFPEPGSPLLMPLLFLLVGLSTAASICVMILTASMMADVTETSEANTGKRTEGLFFAGFFFTQKCVTGIGIFLSGILLSLVGFPESAIPGAVFPEVIDRFATSFAGVTVAIGLIGAWCYTRFPFGQSEHEARLARLGAID